MTDQKPHKGRIKDWFLLPLRNGKYLTVVGTFLDHPHVVETQTSHIVRIDFSTGEVETRNSRYTLVNEGEFGKTSLRNQWPRKSDRMAFLDQNGYPYELEAAQKIFQKFNVYEVAEDAEIHEYSHRIKFVGIDGSWNGVMFEWLRNYERIEPKWTITKSPLCRGPDAEGYWWMPKK